MPILMLGAATLAAASPVGHQPSEESAVLEAMDRFMHAVTSGDPAAMDAIRTPDGMTYRARLDEGGAWGFRSRPSSFYSSAAGADKRPVRERYWSPTVQIRGPIAVVWAPYEYWIDGKTSHCGIDLMSFVKVDGAWKVANSMWTVEPNACAELRPKDPGMLRPSDRPAE
jgi:hypothetical protein